MTKFQGVQLLRVEGDFMKHIQSVSIYWLLTYLPVYVWLLMKVTKEAVVYLRNLSHSTFDPSLGLHTFFSISLIECCVQCCKDSYRRI